MINQIYVEMLSRKIFTKEINPLTEKEFNLDDIKKEEYKPAVECRVKELICEKEINDKLEEGN